MAPAQPVQVGGGVRRARFVDAVAGARLDVALVGRQVAPVGLERARRASPLHLEPGQVLLGVPRQHRHLAGLRVAARRCHRSGPLAASRARAMYNPSTVVSSLSVLAATSSSRSDKETRSVVMYPSSTPSGRRATSRRPVAR